MIYGVQKNTYMHVHGNLLFSNGDRYTHRIFFDGLNIPIQIINNNEGANMQQSKK